MTMQLRRKQIVVLVLTALLAAASFWIPVPHKTLPLDRGAELYGADNGVKQVSESEVNFGRSRAWTSI